MNFPVGFSTKSIFQALVFKKFSHQHTKTSKFHIYASVVDLRFLNFQATRLREPSLRRFGESVQPRVYLYSNTRLSRHILMYAYT